jgi:ABC-type antimicrobial peptide transport system permease subunit
LILLGVLAGVTAGLAMAAVAGARRADTALARFRTTTNAADAVVFASQAGVPHPDWNKLRSRPDVADLAVWSLMFGTVDGEPGSLFFVADDNGFLGRMGRPVVVAGRMWNPDAPAEIVVSRRVAREHHVTLGSTHTFQAFAADQGDGDPEPKGPTVSFKVVGIVSMLNDFLFTDEQVVVGPGFRARYGDQVQLAENADVQLRHGAADVPALQRDVNDLVAPGTPLLDLHAVARRVDTTTDVEHLALLLLGVSIAVAGGLLVAQALARSAGAIGADALVLRAVGMTRSDISWAATLAHIVTFATAVVVATATAVVASQAFPVGLSRQIDPNTGVHIDWTVLLPGLALLVVLLVGGTGLVAYRSAAAAPVRVPRQARIVGAVRSRAPVTVGIGTAMALDGGAGRSRVPVRPALIGAIVGVLGVCGALTLQHGVNDSLRHPERAGVTWDAEIGPPVTSYDTHGLKSDLLDTIAAALPPGSAQATGSRFVVPVDGVGVPALSLDNRTPSTAVPITFALTAGRAPAGDDEAAIGPKTASDLGVGIGDTVDVGDSHTPMRIVGYALFPADVHSEFDEGLWLTKDRFDTLTPVVSSDGLFEGAERIVLVRFPKGTDQGRATGVLARQLGSSVDGVQQAAVPVELTNLRNVRALPLWLAGFLSLLAVAAVSHVLFASSRRRRQEFAVLRAIGLTRRDNRLVLNAQGTVIGLLGLLVGVPLGVALGRVAWHWVADRVPLEDVAPFALIAVVAIVPLTVLVVNALALWPGQRVSRLQPAEVLRAE